MLLCSLTFAATATEDESKPAELEANMIDYDAHAHLGLYEGLVHFIQGSRHLDADVVKTQFDEKNQLIYAVATSNTTIPVHFWGKTDQDKPEVHAYAKKIEYFPEKHLLILKDDAIVIQGDNKIEAPIIKYNILTHHVLTQAIDGKRTKLIIHSDSKII